MATIKNYYDFSGGMNRLSSSFKIKDNECYLIKNCHLDNVGSLTIRKAIRIFPTTNTQIVDDKPVLGMFYFKDIQYGATNYSNILVAIDDFNSTNSDIYKMGSSGEWVKSKEDDTAGAKPVFCSFLDYVFRANGQDTIVSSSDLSSWGTTHLTNFTSMKPKYIWSWNDRLYAAYENGTTKYPSRIYWSTLAKYGSTLSWDTGTNGQWADINPDDNDEITWGIPFGNMALIFKKKSIYRWTFGQTQANRIIAIGTPNGRTVKELNGICFFLGDNNGRYGVYSFDGITYPKLLSKKIQPFLDNIQNIDNCCSEVDDNHYYLYIGTVTVDGVSYSNTILVYTVSLNAWHIETYPCSITAMCRAEALTVGGDSLYNDIYFGNNDGYIMRKNDDTFSSDYYGTLTSPIDVEIITKEYPLPSFPYFSRINRLVVVSSNFNNSFVGYKIGSRELSGEREKKYNQWKALDKRFTEGVINESGRTIQIYLSCVGGDYKTIFDGFSIETQPENVKNIYE